MKKWSWILLIVVILIGAFFLYFNNSKEEKEASEKEIVRNAVEDYLFKEKGYSKEDIKNIEIKYNDKATGVYYKTYAYVTYSDEPDIQYIYFVLEENQKVEHGGFANMGEDAEPKHEPLAGGNS
ncbi:DUF3139 domain-containing protein [Pseudobacillus badius]|uniref:DUF3139 domain-containing protein n=1 Tax=Bacillus badius TaxID=1455 RepID=UPI003CF34770